METNKACKSRQWCWHTGSCKVFANVALSLFYKVGELKPIQAVNLSPLTACLSVVIGCDRLVLLSPQSRWGVSSLSCWCWWLSWLSVSTSRWTVGDTALSLEETKTRAGTNVLELIITRYRNHLLTGPDWGGKLQAPTWKQTPTCLLAPQKTPRLHNHVLTGVYHKIRSDKNHCLFGCITFCCNLIWHYLHQVI